MVPCSVQDGLYVTFVKIHCFLLLIQCPPLQVEIDEYCTKILELRMDDGLLHTCPISADVTSYDASTTDAEGCGGGFPCQAL